MTVRSEPDFHQILNVAEFQIGVGQIGWMYSMSDKDTRVEELLAEMELLDIRLNDNPLDASANARWNYLNTIVTELNKFG